MPTLPNIPALLKECSFSAVRSSGSGGQNVNKLSTKVILTFDVLNSEVLDEEQKELILLKLHNRISVEGILQINASTERTQTGNRKVVAEKFIAFITKAFHVRAPRTATKPTAGSRERRLKEKKTTSQKKVNRSGNISGLTDE